MEQMIYIEQSDKEKASELTRGFTLDNMKNRVFINALGAELAMKYLAQENISISNVYNMHNIHRIIEEFDISDVMLPNIHIDVRVVYDEDLIFVPKSHFEYEITPDLYLVFKMSKDLSFVEFLGFFEPKMLNKNNQNDEYYFFEKEKLSHPSDLKSFIENFDNNTTKTFSEEEILNSQRLALSFVDNDISEADKKTLLGVLAKSSILREDLIEFDNFEVIAYHTATTEDLETTMPIETNSITDEFDSFDADSEFDNFNDDLDFNEENELTDLTENEDLSLDSEFSEETEEEIPEEDLIETEETDTLSIDSEDTLLKEDLEPEEETSTPENIEQDIDDVIENAEEDIITDNITEAGTVDEINFPEGDSETDNLEDTLTLNDNTDIETIEDTESIDIVEDLTTDELEIPQEDTLMDNTSDLPEEDLQTSEIPTLEEESIDLDIDNSDIEDLNIQDEISDNIEDLPNIQDGETTEQAKLIDNLFSMDNYEDDQQEENLPENLPPEEDSISTETLDEIDTIINSQDTPLETTINETLSLHEDIDELMQESDQQEQQAELSEPESEQESEHEQELESESEQELEKEPEQEITETPIITDEVTTQEEISNNSSEYESDTVNLEDLDTVLSSLEAENAEQQETEPEQVQEPTRIEEQVQEETPTTFENSTTITNSNIVAGEIPIDINIDNKSEEEEKLEVLYNENGEIKNDIAPINIETPAQEKGKKAIIIASAMVALIAAGSVGAYMMLNKGNTQVPQQPIGNINDNTIPQQIEDQPIPQTPNVDKPVENNVQMQNTQTPAVTATQPPAGETPYIDVKKLGWSIPNYLSYNDTFKKYLQTAGKSLKLSLSSDLLMATEYNYSELVQVDITLSKEGTIQDAKILQTSGSTQIDNIVLQTVKDTLNVVKAPAGLIEGDSAHLTLKIYL